MATRRPSRLAAITGLTLTSTLLGLLASPAAVADSAPAPPANLRVEEVRTDHFTVAWDPVAGATEYGLSLIPLEVGGNYARAKSPDPIHTFSNLTADVSYKVTVRAFVPSAYPNWYTTNSVIIVTTPLPEGYAFPTAPTNLRAVRDSSGVTTELRWDPPSQSFGPLTYRIFFESADSAELNGVFGHTTGLSIDAGYLPLNTGWLGPGGSVSIRINATDRIFHTSPLSEPVVITCCPE